MKKKTINMINTILIPFKVLLIILIVLGMYNYFSTVFINEEVDYGRNFKSLPEHSLDIITLGSSHAQYSVIPGFIYNDTGLYNYVLGSACQPLEVSYEMLKEALKTQSPELVILEVYTSMPLRSVCEADSSYIIAQYQMRDDEKYNTIDYLEEEKASTYYNELIINHNMWKTAENIEDWLPSNLLMVDYSYIDYNLGYIPFDRIDSNNSWYAAKYDANLDVELDELDLKSLNNIYELCKKNGIDLLLFKTPIDNISQEDQSYLHKVWEWAEDNNIRYIDFIQESEALNYRMWIHSDSYHAFTNGAQIISTRLANEINSYYEFNHMENNDLNELYQYNSNIVMNSFLKSEIDPYASFDRLQDYTGLMLIKYSSSDYEMDSWLEYQLSTYSDNLFTSNDNFYAIIDDGEVKYYSNIEISETYDGNNILINKDEVLVNDVAIETKGLLTLILSDDEFNVPVVKNIEYRGYVWEYGYDNYKNNNVE